MHAPTKHIIRNNTFWLSPQRCIFWEEEQVLILSDLHLGKTGHFRKHGIAIPQNVFLEDMQRLVEQIMFYKPRAIIAVGDLFHSGANKEMDLFLKWRSDLSELPMILVKGNHDILEDDWYTKARIEVKEGMYTVNDFSFVHDPDDAPEETDLDGFIFSGHLHPGVHIQGLAKQGLSFPCYYFEEHMAIIPAFSKFSGLAMVRKTKSNTVYAIVNQSLVNVR